MAGEFDLIDWIQRNQTKSPMVLTGIGDDLALLKWPANDLLLVGVDQVIDGVHFDSSVHSPEQIGRKVINRNLSDCAAMGCLPAAAVVAVALPKAVSIEYAKQLYVGLRDAAGAHDCPIVGGDTATWDGKLVVSVTILGRSDGVRPVTRGGAIAGNDIYVTGPLGGSDGLSRDLGHICRASGVGAVIETELVPIHSDAAELSRRDGVSALEHALNDGEDYELLLSGPTGIDGAIRVGRIVPEPGIHLMENGATRPLQARGWQHEMGR